MNKKEIAEIKKNFSDESGLFVIRSVLTAYVNSEKQVLCSEVRDHVSIEPDEAEVILETLKKTLSGTLGKNLTEYSFPKESYEEGGAQFTLYNALKNKLRDEASNTAFIDRIKDNADIAENFVVITGLCTYSVLKKSKNDERLDDSDLEYNFLITAICPANTGDEGLFYDSARGGIFKKSNTEMIISKAPQDGFLFPVFSDRSSDVNAVMYYTRSPKKPNLSIIEDVLECTFSYTADDEKEKFRAVLSQVCADDLDYSTITQVNDVIEDIIAQNKNETEPPMIDSGRLRNILADVGIREDRLEAVTGVYETIVGDFALTASNLVEKKTVLSAESITVNIGKDATDKVRTSVIQGRKCLVIDLDDPKVTVNGMEMEIAAGNDQQS